MLILRKAILCTSAQSKPQSGGLPGKSVTTTLASLEILRITQLRLIKWYVCQKP